MNNVVSAECVKDWTLVLVTLGVVALGWLTSTDRQSLPAGAVRLSCLCFCLSIVFGVLVMCVLPGVIDDRSVGDIYDGIGDLYPLWFFKVRVKLVYMCWPQHVLFMCGIFCYVAAAVSSRVRSSISS